MERGEVLGLPVSVMVISVLSVSLQMMSPFSRDLLNRVIIQSDSFMSVSYHPMTGDQSLRMADRLQSQLGCTPGSSLLDCLNDRNTFQILASALSVSVETYTFGLGDFVCSEEF